ncbi:MAG: glycosyltransferase family 2 protein [Verrucomicrobiae bacterium]|nr:glycosyltransferase family 2 protein [Verrucomicrobiae bacterium]
MNLAIIIPARDEEGSISTVLRLIPCELAQQIIVVDNGSTDKTAMKAQAAGAEVIEELSRGYGQACLTGLAHLRDDIDVIGFLDADGSDDPRLLEQLLEPIRDDQADFVLSARVLGEARKNLSPQQRFGNWLACFLIRLLWGHCYTDLGPLRVIRRDALARLGMIDTTWGWTVEMQIKAVEHRLRIVQIPVPYGRRLAGKSKISGTLMGTIRAGTKILSTIGMLYFASPKPVTAAATPAARKSRVEALESTRL